MEVKKTKKINIKNKKVVKSALEKTSIRGIVKTKSSTAKSSSIKKKSNSTKKVAKVIDEKKKRVVTEPNNVKRKIAKDTKKKKEVKSFTSKIEFPKEWKTINSKNSKIKKKEEKPKTIKGKIRSSIFESIDEKDLIEQKKREKEGLKKFLLIFLIVIASFTLLILVLLKYNDFVRRQLATYKAYKIGDAVYLKDDSLWYVIKDTSSKEGSVKLLSGKLVDINDDNAVDTNDRVIYNSGNNAEYDPDDENSAAFILKNSIKGKYEELIGSIKEISLLTVDEYVKARDRLSYGDEWDNGNFLANNDLQKWWILSNKNNKVYVVSSKGTFYLSDAKNYYFIRPTITISKDLIIKDEESKEISLDLINGLK